MKNKKTTCNELDEDDEIINKIQEDNRQIKSALMKILESNLKTKKK